MLETRIAGLMNMLTDWDEMVEIGFDPQLVLQRAHEDMKPIAIDEDTQITPTFFEAFVLAAKTQCIATLTNNVSEIQKMVIINALNDFDWVVFANQLALSSQVELSNDEFNEAYTCQVREGIRLMLHFGY